MTIPWSEWSPDAFDRAVREDKPILLNLTATWCHWCHVMDETSYADPEIIRRISEGYVPIRVDVDRRPDIAERFNFGGVPTAALLTPTGEMIAGGTYFPPDQLSDLLDQVRAVYVNQREEIYKKVREVDASSPLNLFHPPAAVSLEEGVQKVLEILRTNYDSRFGGFEDPPKHIYLGVFDVLFFLHRESGDKTFLDMVTRTLDFMPRTMEDPVEGGFFRSADQRDWKGVHTEKVLEVEATMAKTYLAAYALTKKESYRETASGIIHYVQSTLRDPQTGAFFGSQDADDAYYRLDAAGRAAKKAPAVDETIYMHWNAQWISALFTAASVLNESSYRETAEHVLTFLLSRGWDRTRGTHHYYDGRPGGPSLFMDAVALASACLDAHDPSGKALHLAEARQLMDQSIALYWDEKKGGFFDIVADPDAVAALKERQKTLPDNAMAVRVLVRLAALTGEAMYGEKAEETVSLLAQKLDPAGYYASPYAVAVKEFLAAKEKQ